jgi:hypothetical protein
MVYSSFFILSVPYTAKYPSTSTHVGLCKYEEWEKQTGG